MKTVCKKLFSLLLVAALLISAVPFPAFANHSETPDENHTSKHVMGEYVDNGDGTHTKTCTQCSYDVTDDCVYVEKSGEFVCKICGHECDHSNTEVKPDTEPTCTKDGKEGDEVCLDCGKVITKGGKLDKLGHEDADGNGKCDRCTEAMPEEHNAATLNLDPNGGLYDGLSSGVLACKTNSPISGLKNPVFPGYSFTGWYIGSTKIENGTKFRPEWDGETAVAHWAEKTYTLTVYRLLNGKDPKKLCNPQVGQGENVLKYLEANVTGIIEAELANNPGYKWEGEGYWYNYTSSSKTEIKQSDKMDKAQTVYVNFTSNKYTIYFVADGGTVSPATKEVTYNKAVGTLPTPKKDGKVFLHWADFAGKVYTKDTIYKVEGDTTLTAVWEDEALVLLKIYANGDFNAKPIVVIMDGYITDSTIYRDAVEKIVKKYYAAQSGKTMSIAGLFDDDTWPSYKANSSTKGTPTVEVSGAHPMNVYVMVNNAKLSGTNGGSSSGGSSSGSGSSGSGSSSSNPKTGDSAYIGTAAAVMVLAAAGFVTVNQLRKKKVF